MNPPLLWVVVPTCRPERLEWIRDRFVSQHYPNKALLVVENGDAIGAVRESGIHPHEVVQLRGEPHVSRARNAGIEAVRELGDWMCFWDDDDYYGPHYLTEVAAAIGTGGIADVIGKRRHFIAFREHGLYLFNERNQWSEALYLHGPTLTFRASQALPFPEIPEGEEMKWAEAMRARGASLRGLSIHHYCYMRGGDRHIFQASPEYIALISMSNDFVYWLGDVECDVIDGKRDWRDRIRKTEGERVSLPFRQDGGSSKLSLQVDADSKSFKLDTRELEAPEVA